MQSLSLQQGEEVKEGELVPVALVEELVRAAAELLVVTEGNESVPLNLVLNLKDALDKVRSGKPKAEKKAPTQDEIYSVELAMNRHLNSM